MSRRGARRNAFYLLFQMDFSEAEEFEQVKELFFAEKEEPVEKIRNLFFPRWRAYMPTWRKLTK